VTADAGRQLVSCARQQRILHMSVWLQRPVVKGNVWRGQTLLSSSGTWPLGVRWSRYAPH